jgi:ribosomal protein S18 acetylase RimI-like enzyme
VALADEGFRTAALDVDSDSPTGALGLYERNGFRVKRTETVYALEPRSAR